MLLKYDSYSNYITRDKHNGKLVFMKELDGSKSKIAS